MDRDSESESDSAETYGMKEKVIIEKTRDRTAEDVTDIIADEKKRIRISIHRQGGKEKRKKEEDRENKEKRKIKLSEYFKIYDRKFCGK